jgi:hypothetical protein
MMHGQQNIKFDPCFVCFTIWNKYWNIIYSDINCGEYNNTEACII